MKKEELRQILKPLIKECIKEVIFEEGVLSNIITEVAHGLGTTQRIVEAAPAKNSAPDEDLLRAEQQRKNKTEETRRKRAQVLGASTTINGMNVFEGVDPIAQEASPAKEDSQVGPLSGVAPGDPGVDISSIFSSKWGKLAKG